MIYYVVCYNDVLKEVEKAWDFDWIYRGRRDGHKSPGLDVATEILNFSDPNGLLGSNCTLKLYI